MAEKVSVYRDSLSATEQRMVHLINVMRANAYSILSVAYASLLWEVLQQYRLEILGVRDFD